MKLEDILKLMEAAQNTDFDTFELEDEEFYLKLERNKPIQQVFAPVQSGAAQPFAEAAAAVPVAQPEAAQAVPNETNETQKTPGSKDIPSPLVGIFHELPGGKAIKTGTKVKKGDVVCLVEAMKLMNEIQMPEDGEIAWVAAAEGDTVEYGQLLFSYN